MIKKYQMVKAIGTRIEIYYSKMLKFMRMMTAEYAMMKIMMIDLNQEITQNVVMKMVMNNTFKKLLISKNNLLVKNNKFKLI